MSLTIMISVAAFIAVAAFVGGIALLFRKGENSLVEDRLDMLAGGVTTAGRPESRSMEPSLLSQPLEEQANAIESFLAHFGNVRLFLEQADIRIAVPKFMLICAAIGGAGGLLCLAMRLPIYVAPAAGLPLASLPFVAVFIKRKMRLGKFSAQLPDAMELVSRALRAGHSLAAAFQLVQSEMPDPIGIEFGRVYESQNLGIPLDEALEEMADRVPNVDLRFFATAVILQRQTGGDLAEILDKIGHLIRERFKIWGQVKALTGEGRLSGIILLALPPILFGVMYKLNPDYVMMLFNDPLGNQMLAVAIILQVVGALVIRKIVNIKV
jgi:tight adherence protein B